MSKIEKALERAGYEKNSRPTGRSGSHEAAPPLGAMVASTPERRAKARREIALMLEPEIRGEQELEQLRIIHPAMPEASGVNAFRELRTKIIQASRGQGCAVLVTAPAGDSGTSFVAFNLGAAFAFDAENTAVVIDCNMRDPSFQRLPLARGVKGITDYVEDPRLNVADVIHSVGIRRLRVVPAGDNRDVPAEYLSSVRMQQLIQDIKQQYVERYVIVDAPPMTQAADVQVLLDFCDHVILVVPSGKVTEAQVAACARTIGQRKLLGVVFNDVPRPPLDWRSRLGIPTWRRLGATVRNMATHKKWRWRA